MTHPHGTLAYRDAVLGQRVEVEPLLEQLLPVEVVVVLLKLPQ
jgi:hypothetical protein